MKISKNLRGPGRRTHKLLQFSPPPSCLPYRTLNLLFDEVNFPMEVSSFQCSMKTTVCV